MLKKMVQSTLQEIVSGNGFLAMLCQRLYESELFRQMLGQVVDEIAPPVVLSLDDGDIIVVPGNITQDDFERISEMLPRKKRIGVISADNVRLLKLS